MADKWIATTHIKHGEGNKVLAFQPGMEVTGFDEGAMDGLRAAGAVTKQSEIDYAKAYLSGGASNSFSLNDIPDTPAGRKVREAFEALREEEQSARTKQDAEVNIPPAKAAEVATAQETLKDSGDGDTTVEGEKTEETKSTAPNAVGSKTTSSAARK